MGHVSWCRSGSAASTELGAVLGCPGPAGGDGRRCLVRDGGRHCETVVLGNFSITELKITVPSDCTNQCCLVWLQTFYRCLEEHEADAAMVLEAECKRLLQNL